VEGVSDADVAGKSQQVVQLDPKSRSETAPTMFFGQNRVQWMFRSIAMKAFYARGSRAAPLRRDSLAAKSN
jgi:hypothetical protein